MQPPTQLQDLQRNVMYMKGQLQLNMRPDSTPLSEAERQQLLAWIEEFEQLMRHMQATAYDDDLVAGLLSRMTL